MPKQYILPSCKSQFLEKKKKNHKGKQVMAFLGWIEFLQTPKNLKFPKFL
jgi:hypothetical protein